MTYAENEKLECLIRLAFDEITNREAEEFLALDTKDIVVSDRLNKRVAKLIKEETKSGKGTVPVKRQTLRLMIAAILLMTVIIGTMLSVSAIRKFIWQSIVTLYDNYVAINFVQAQPSDGEGDGKNDIITDNETTSLSAQSNDSAESESVCLAAIETYKKPHVEDKYEEEELMKGKAVYQIDYYIGDDYYFSYCQKPLTKDNQLFDNEYADIENVKIGSFEGVFVVTDSKNNLIFADEYYFYHLNGSINKDELIRIAETIK